MEKPISKFVNMTDDGRYLLPSWSGERRGWLEVLAWVKDSFPQSDRSFNGKTWKIKYTDENRRKLLQYGFTLVGNALFPNGGLTSLIKPIKVTPISKSLLHKELLPYQIDGAGMIATLRGNALLADPMGLGKTAQVCLYMKAYQNDTLPAIVICPAIGREHWKRELRKWADIKKVVTIYGTDVHTLPTADVYVIGYDILSKWLDTLLALNPKYIVADECHYLKNPDSIRTKAFRELARRRKFTGVSGTPLKNRPAELYTVLHQLDPRNFNNQWMFLNRYCDPKCGRFGLEFKGATNIDELHSLVSGFMIRRKREDVLVNMPKVNKRVLPMELVDYKKYLDLEDDILKEKDKKKRERGLDGLSQTAFNEKKDAIFEWIDNWLEDNPGEKLVLMGYHRAVLDALQDRYKKISVRIDGSVDPEKRQGIVDKFQTDKNVRVFIGQMIAAGVLITLTAAYTLAFVEVYYVPGDLDQAECRVIRVTQKHPYVFIYYLIGAGTIEDDIMEAVQSKTRNISAIMDGESVEFFTKDMLIDKMKKRRKK